MCSSLTILDDSVLENEQRIMVILETYDPRVLISEENGRASVVITDNDDGEFYLSCIFLAK